MIIFILMQIHEGDNDQQIDYRQPDWHEHPPKCSPKM